MAAAGAPRPAPVSSPRQGSPCGSPGELQGGMEQRQDIPQALGMDTPLCQGYKAHSSPGTAQDHFFSKPLKNEEENQDFEPREQHSPFHPQQEHVARGLKDHPEPPGGTRDSTDGTAPQTVVPKYQGLLLFLTPGP